MFVGDRARQIRPIEHVAGIAHGKRKRYRLGAAHASEEDRHRERGNLSLSHRARGDFSNERRDLFGRQRQAVALAADDFLGEHQP